MMELRNLHIGYTTGKRAKTVFKDINASFGKGELIGLVGNNGVGKSTLLKTITGNLRTLGGDILLDGKNISGYSTAEVAKLISIVLTDKITGFNLTVFDVVASGRLPYLNSFAQLRDDDKKIIAHSIAKVGIEELSEATLDELSDGQRQKVMIAKSLAQQTPVILLDEPTAFLDYTSKQQLFQILKQLAVEEEKTILISSHDLEILFKNVDKVLFLKGNNEYSIGSPDVIRQNFT